MTKAAQSKNSRIDLMEWANDCAYDPNSFIPLFIAIRQEIRTYDPENEFGAYLDGHLQRVRTQMEEFMLHCGYSAKVSRIIGDAFALHDLGKILQEPDIWKLSVAKPDRTEHAKTERPRHTELGSVALNMIMEKIGFVPSTEQERFLDIARYMMLNHHERPDGKGPRGMSGNMLCTVLHMAIVVDTYDGKTKTGKDYSQIIAEMKGEKHMGRLDMAVVSNFDAFYRSQQGRRREPDPLALNTVS